MNDWKTVEELFNKALDIDKNERATYLKNICGENENLYNEVISLLNEDEEIHPLLNKKASELVNIEEKLNFIGQKIGNFELVQEIASGGMGTVFLAERCDGVFEQKVALKIIKPGLSTIPIIRRFQHERQILANLQHPNIARIYDGGVTDDRRPFFTMEYVEGIHVDEYCDNNKLTVKDRLNLFIKICETVQFAHNNLVIHRDLKPSNILIKNDGTIKLLDFGISKVLSAESENNDMPTITQAEINLLTPEYSSPEQIKNNPISVATDVYSLGLILYKLLCGQNGHEFKSRTFNEFEKVICEQKLEKPSSTFLKENADEIARNRNVSKKKLTNILSGDLDNICLMALRKEPDRRYPSAEMLALDLERYLNNLPILARKESVAYSTKKFVVRHKASVITAAVLFFIVNGLILFYTIQLKAERDKANLEAKKSEQVASFMQNLFLVSDPNQSKGETITARELLDRGTVQLKDGLREEPEIRTQLLNTIGKVYTNLGLYSSAEEILVGLKKSKFKNQIDNETYLESLILLAELYRIEGKYDNAEKVLGEALTNSTQSLEDNNPILGDIYYNFGGLYFETGDFENSEIYYKRAEKNFRMNFGEKSEKVAAVIHEQGVLEFDKGNLDKVESLYRKALQIAIELTGETNANVAEYENSLGQVLRHKGKFNESKVFYEKALATRKKLFGKNHPDVAHTLNHLSRLYYNQELYDNAEPLAREALEIRLKIFDDDHPEVSASRSSLAGILFNKKKYKEAEALYRKAYLSSLNKFGESHPYTPAIQGNIGRTLLEQKKYTEAEDYLNKSLINLKQIFGLKHVYTLGRTVWLSDLYNQTLRFEDAEELIKLQLDSIKNNSLENHWLSAVAKSQLGYSLFKQNKDLEAEGMLVFGYNKLLEAKGKTNKETQKALTRIIEFYRSKGREDKIKEYSAKL